MSDVTKSSARRVRCHGTNQYSTRAGRNSAKNVSELNSMSARSRRPAAGSEHACNFVRERGGKLRAAPAIQVRDIREERVGHVERRKVPHFRLTSPRHFQEQPAKTVPLGRVALG